MPSSTACVAGSREQSNTCREVVFGMRGKKTLQLANLDAGKDVSRVQARMCHVCRQGFATCAGVGFRV